MVGRGAWDCPGSWSGLHCSLHPESGKAGSTGLASGKFPTRYLVSGLAVRKGDAEEKLLEMNKDLELKMSKETEEVCRQQLGVFQAG